MWKSMRIFFINLKQVKSIKKKKTSSIVQDSLVVVPGRIWNTKLALPLGGFHVEPGEMAQQLVPAVFPVPFLATYVCETPGPGGSGAS